MTNIDIDIVTLSTIHKAICVNNCLPLWGINIVDVTQITDSTYAVEIENNFNGEIFKVALDKEQMSNTGFIQNSKGDYVILSKGILPKRFKFLDNKDIVIPLPFEKHDKQLKVYNLAVNQLLHYSYLSEFEISRELYPELFSTVDLSKYNSFYESLNYSQHSPTQDEYIKLLTAFNVVITQKPTEFYARALSLKGYTSKVINNQLYYYKQFSGNWIKVTNSVREYLSICFGVELKRNFSLKRFNNEQNYEQQHSFNQY